MSTKFVDPKKIFKALEYLKASGHPGYSKFNTREEDINRCREGDKEGYENLFGLDNDEEDEVNEELGLLINFIFCSIVSLSVRILVISSSL